MRIWMLLLLLLVSGCKTPMTNDEIVTEVKKCKDAGMKFGYSPNILGEVIRVQCYPLNER